MILKCIGHSCLRVDEYDHNNILVPEAAAAVAANNGDGVVHQQEEIKKKEKSIRFSSSCWQRIIVKWKKEIRGNKDLGKTLENVSKHESQLDELSGRYRKEASFNLGIGFGLLYHNAALKDELNKMIELRGQMQRILQNVENALATSKTTNPISPTKKVSNHLDVCESSNQGAESRTTFVCDNYHDCETTTQERFSEGMDQLEEELEAELEQLQLHLDTEVMLKHQEEGKLQMNVLETAGGLSQSGRRYKEVVVDHREEAAAEVVEHNGVSPTELARRLHGLLESRQEERIKELEVALEIAKRKIFEKEREVSWWKNTASIISKHVPEPSFLHR